MTTKRALFLLHFTVVIACAAMWLSADARDAAAIGLASAEIVQVTLKRGRRQPALPKRQSP